MHVYKFYKRKKKEKKRGSPPKGTAFLSTRNVTVSVSRMHWLIRTCYWKMFPGPLLQEIICQAILKNKEIEEYKEDFEFCGISRRLPSRYKMG